jgi:hypothetical protein
MEYEPIAVALKFGFIAVLYLFLLWVARSSLRDLRGTSGEPYLGAVDDAAHDLEGAPADAWLVVEKGGGLKRGSRYDLFGGVSIGRSDEADVPIDDRYASGVHARIFAQRGGYYVEDMNSTNGTFLNGDPVDGEIQLKPDDLVQIGDTEFRYEVAG